jgi:phenylacetate-CoA ligase
MRKKNVKTRLGSIPILKCTQLAIIRLFPVLSPSYLTYLKWSRFIDSSQGWTEEQIKEYQWNHLKDLIIYCNTNVPYYQELFRKIGAQPDDFRSFEDYSKIPFLTKEIIRENSDKLLSVSENRNHVFKYNTGGSTGIPLMIYKTITDDIIERAFMTNQWSRVGYKPMDSRVIIRGEVIEGNKLWVYYPSTNAWVFSSYHLSPEYIDQMVEKLNWIKPKFLHVYPSSLWIFANLIKEHKLKLNFTPQAILCGSEKLFEHQRNFFSEIFGCRSFSWLGLAEQTILAGECEYSTDLHIFPQHSFIELVDDNGVVISQPGITGQIVGTTFHRHSFPFLRYISGDMASYTAGICSCGRNFHRFGEIEGRVQNVIVSRDGRIIPLTALVFGQHLLAFDKVEKMQLFQGEKGVVDVRLIKGVNFTEEDAATLCNQLLKASKNTVSFTISYHDSLERTPSGKHKFLIQQLPVDFYAFEQNS